MTVTETLLVYAGIPLAIMLVTALFTTLRSKGKPARYKPGAAWEHPDIWWEPHHGPGAHGSGHAGELITGHGETPHGTGGSLGTGEHRALESGARQPGALAAALAIGETPHGATAIGAGGEALPPRTAAGGARGTW